jgi:hypothetical protein
MKMLFMIWLSLLPLGMLSGCATVHPSATPESSRSDPLVDEIIKQEALDKKGVLAKPRTNIVLEEIPLKTPVDRARSIMQGHGFTCWAGVPDQATGGICLYCSAYKRVDSTHADRVVAKLFYEQQRVVKIEVTVDSKTVHPDHGIWSLLY